MNAIDRLVGFISPAAGVRRLQARAQIQAMARLGELQARLGELQDKNAREARAYDAARPGRATAAWSAPQTSARSETYMGLPWLRARSHDLHRNNPNSVKITSSLVNALVGGDGIGLTAATGDKALDKKIDALARDVFDEIDIDGHCLAGLQSTGANTLMEGGEGVLRLVRRKRSCGLRLPFQFRLLEAEYIDNRQNRVLTNGNKVIQGVELDAALGVPVAYWMFVDHPGDTYLAPVDAAYEVVRVPAAEVFLFFETLRPGQLRGVPWQTPILLRARALDDYEDYERERKKLESSIPAFVKPGLDMGGEASDGAGPSLFPTVVDANGHLVEQIRPGLIAYLRNATDVTLTKPADAMGFAPFKRSELMSISAGARVPYEIGSGDLSQTNYSSIKYGSVDFRLGVDRLRKTTLIRRQLRPIWRTMIDYGVAVGELPRNCPYHFEAHPPPWQDIDPEKGSAGAPLDARSGTKSLIQLVKESGRDPARHFTELGQVAALLDELNLVLDSDPRRTDKRGIEQPSFTAEQLHKAGLEDAAAAAAAK